MSTFFNILFNSACILLLIDKMNHYEIGTHQFRPLWFLIWWWKQKIDLWKLLWHLHNELVGFSKCTCTWKVGALPLVNILPLSSPLKWIITSYNWLFMKEIILLVHFCCVRNLNKTLLGNQVPGLVWRPSFSEPSSSSSFTLCNLDLYLQVWGHIWVVSSLTYHLDSLE